MVHLLFPFLLTNVLFAFAVFTVLMRWNKAGNYGKWEVLLLSMGLAPGITSLVMYYILWLLPGLSSTVHICFVLGVFVLLGILGAKQFSQLKQLLGSIPKTMRHEWRVLFKKEEGKKSLDSAWWLLVVLFPFLGWWSYATLLTPITGHDMLEYIYQSRVMFQDAAVVYEAHHYDAGSGFYYVGLHAWGFPLLHSWELTLNTITGTSYDLFAKVQTPWYLLLAVFTAYYWLRKKSGALANYTVLLMLFTYGYFVTGYSVHLDTFRTFFILLLFVAMLKVVKYNDILSWRLVGVLGGMAAFAHSLGLLVACMALFTLLFYAQGKFKERLPKLVMASILLLVFGGIHYVVDIFFGTGWIFQNIKFY